MQKLVSFIWRLFSKRPPFVWRVVIMFLIGGILPVLVHYKLSLVWGPKAAVGMFLLFFWPIAALMMYLRNEGWLDDEDE